MRAEWLNLNGEWEFAETDEGTAFLGDVGYPDKIVVPFCRESSLSGLKRLGFVKNVWYRRTFEVPVAWQARRIRLHVGACDWRTRVWINDTLVGQHLGGSAPFVFDVTDTLRPGKNTVVIHAFDDTRSGLQMCGKQSQKEKSHGCVYTRTTGIWQTVWLEGVGESYVRQFSAVPDPKNERVVINAEVVGRSQGVVLTAAARAGGKVVATARSPADWRHTSVVLKIPKPRLWSVDDPFLYDLTLTLSRDGKTIDSLTSYVGLRTVSIEGRAILINGKPVFQRTVLDQGFYPDGIWTAPTDAALKRDIELSKAAGFNGARLHQKVFEPRFLYWADKMGYLVWGELPNWGADNRRPEVNLPILDEWVELLARDRNHPSIIGWCPFNETRPPAGALQRSIVNITRQIDPTRPVLESSGYHHSHPDPDLLDAHDYNQAPASFKQRWDGRFADTPLPERYGGGADKAVPFFVSEYGGIGWKVGKGGWGYGNNPKSLDAFYERHKGLTDAQLDNRYLFGFCYTQLTDIEQEQNGVYTYTRKPKFDVARLYAINSRRAAYEVNPPLAPPPATRPAWKVLVGAVPDGPMSREWRYVTETPPTDWAAPGFDDSAWKVGRAGFGKKGGWENRIRTPWTGKDIWLRQAFQFDGGPVGRALLVAHYDNATEVYVNGKQIWKRSGWNDAYAGSDVTGSVGGALRPGKNVIAIHCHQDEGGQYIDAALLVAPRSRTAMDLQKEAFGKTSDGKTVDLYTLTNANGMRVRIISHGAFVISIEVPDRNGKLADVTLGYDDLPGYLKDGCHFGSVCGRYANRIAKGKFTLDGVTYTLAVNNGPNHLHGGIKGFNRMLWQGQAIKEADAVGVKLSYLSRDGEEGYPGNLTCSVTYLLTDDNALKILYEAETDKPTPINLTNHSYFNLAGQGTGDILGHEMMITADRFTPVDETLIPTGELRAVKGTPLDFTKPTAIGARIDQDDEQLRFGKGYDHNYVLNSSDGSLALAARVYEPRGGRVMEVYTTEPGVQLYTGNFLDGKVVGKSGRAYKHRYGFCLETQHFPDSPNQGDFPSTILRPGQQYKQTTVYKFLTR